MSKVRRRLLTTNRIFFVTVNLRRDIPFLDWRWSSYNNFALEKERVAACPLPIDYVRVPA